MSNRYFGVILFVCFISVEGKLKCDKIPQAFCSVSVRVASECSMCEKNGQESSSDSLESPKKKSLEGTKSHEEQKPKTKRQHIETNGNVVRAVPASQRSRMSIKNKEARNSSHPQRIDQSSCDKNEPYKKPCVPLNEANERIRECCEKKNFGTCMPLCRYDINPKEAQNLFRTKDCKIKHIDSFFKCAAGGSNNLNCCKYNKVIEKTGSQCSKFCAPATDTRPFSVSKDIVCTNEWSAILHCHHMGLK